MRHCFWGKQEQSTPGLEYCLGGFQLCGFCKSTLASLNFGFPIDNIKQTKTEKETIVSPIVLVTVLLF